MIKAHDITHIIFGSDTSYEGEFTVQTWFNLGGSVKIPWNNTYKYVFNKDLIQIILLPKLISNVLIF
jgi:hypothetical protein